MLLFKSISSIKFTARKSMKQMFQTIFQLTCNKWFILLSACNLLTRAKTSGSVSKDITHNSNTTPPSNSKIMRKSHGWKIFVEIKGEGIEFLASCIGLKGPELVPPMLTSVFPYWTFLLVQCVVQEIRQHTSNKRFRWEWYVDNVIELQITKSILHHIYIHTRIQA